jgi:hypothetical protein
VHSPQDLPRRWKPRPRCCCSTPCGERVV